jgi:1,4-alpha-glucan branching enzyme
MTKSKKKTKRSEMLKKTEFSVLAPQAQRVSIAGDFNQ